MLMILGIVLGIPLVRSYTKRVENTSRMPQLPSDLTARLERIEQAVEAMATEVERIAEGQRFTTKLLSESRAQPALSAGQPAAQPAAQPQPPAQSSVPNGTVLVESARRV
jgi:hypothetical protein